MQLSLSKVRSYCERTWSRENVIQVLARIATRVSVAIVWCGVLWSLLGNSALPLQFFNQNDEDCIVSNANISVLENNSIKLPQDTLQVLSNSKFSLVALSFDNNTNEYKLLQVKRSKECDNHLEVQGVDIALDHNLTTWEAVTTVININDLINPEEPTGLIYITDGHFFALVLLLIFSSVCGFLAKLVFLPPLFGMIIAGIILRNVPYIDFAKYIQPTWSSTIRNIALVIILIRGGLSMKAKDLKRLKHAVLILGSLPCVLEGAMDGIIATFYLKMPWQWGFMLGYVVLTSIYRYSVWPFCIVDWQRYAVSEVTYMICTCSSNLWCHSANCK